MNNNELGKYSMDFLDKPISNTEDSYKKKSFVCSMYLLKYINDEDKDAYNNFVLMFKNLSYEDRIQVLLSVKNNLSKQEHIKVKKKDIYE